MTDFFHLAHENKASTDEWGRVLYAAVQTKHPAVIEPIASKHDMPISWPDGKQFALCLTHDIDTIQLPHTDIRWYAWQALRKGCLIHAGRALLGRIFSSLNPHAATIRTILRLERKYNAQSTFFFMAADDSDTRYDIANAKRLLHAVQQAGSEVGLHAGIDSVSNADRLQEEKKRLESVLGNAVSGLRQHYLRFDRKSWAAQAAAGFAYDATLGYADQVGFRNGSAFPFFTFTASKKPLALLEIPLGIMDVSLSHYMQLPFDTSADAAWEQCEAVLTAVRDAGGCISILWHNDQFDPMHYPGSAALYERILQFGKEHNAWMTSGEQITAHVAAQAS